MVEGVSVYVVEGHEYGRAGLVDLISRGGGLVVGSSCSSEVGLVDIVRLRPSVAVLDGNLGDANGLALCRGVLAAAPEVGCVILSAGVGVCWGVSDAAEAGAAAFVLKGLVDFPLVEVIGRVASGERLI